jgi:hypothetical protein
MSTPVDLNDDDKLELDALIEKTMDNVNASKHVSQTKAFNKLTSRLFRHEENVLAPSIQPSSQFISKVQSSSHLYDSNVEAAPLKKVKDSKEEGLKGWFDMKVKNNPFLFILKWELFRGLYIFILTSSQPLKLDDKIKRDLKVIQMRNYLDPKRCYLIDGCCSCVEITVFLFIDCRFYKNPDKPGVILHIGTVIEGPSEYKSARLTNKERKQSLVEEILADSSIVDYSKRKFSEIQSSALKRKGKKGLKGRMTTSKSTKKIRMLF